MELLRCSEVQLVLRRFRGSGSMSRCRAGGRRN